MEVLLQSRQLARFFDGDDPVQAFLADGAAPTGSVRDLMPASRHQLALVRRGAGSGSHVSRNVSAHRRFRLNSCRALYQSRDPPARKSPSRRSGRVLSSVPDNGVTE